MQKSVQNKFAIYILKKVQPSGTRKRKVQKTLQKCLASQLMTEEENNKIIMLCDKVIIT